MTAVITAMSVVCPGGRGPEQLWATVRAGISRIVSSYVIDRHLEPIRMGLVPEDALEPELPPEFEALPLPARARRMLRLAAPALRTVLATTPQRPVRLYLGLPELGAAEAPWIKSFALQLGKMAEVQIDAPNSRVVPGGRAAVLNALQLALDALERDPSHPIVLGGVDYLDLRLLSSLDADGRLLGSHVSDGFIPSEGAAFLALSHPGGPGVASGEATITVQAAAAIADPAHRTATAPARGEGLAQALEQLRSKTASTGPVASTFAGLNGESFEAKLWGVARVRHADFFAPALELAHPADCFGDCGAATGAILAVLAATALAKRHRPSPALIWAASDGESLGGALLSSHGT